MAIPFTQALTLNAYDSSNPFDGTNQGQYANYFCVDYDGDGDADCFLGDYEDTTIRYLKNTGTAFVPDFELNTADNPFNGLSLETPALWCADMDGDIDLDCFISGSNYAIYVRNDADSYVQQSGANNPFDGFTFNEESTVTLGRFTTDNLIDAVIGDVSGLLRFFKNTGTAGAPDFTELTGTANPFDGFDAGSYSTPTSADYNGDGFTDLFVGEWGTTGIVYFLNDGDDTFTQYASGATENPFRNYPTITGDASAFLYDFDGDGIFEAVVGERGRSDNYYNSGGCNAGYYGSENICYPCGVGTYNGLEGQGSCIDCPDGGNTLGEGSLSVDDCTSCPSGFSLANGLNCYRMTTISESSMWRKNFNWEGAKTACAAYGGYLASFADREEYDAFMDYATANAWFGTSPFWTSGRKRGNKYKWTAGELAGDRIDTDLWSNGEPNANARQICVQGNYGSDMALDNVACEIKKVGLCQTDM